MINIIHHNWAWAHGLSRRLRTDFIVLHHSAGHGDADAIHKLHLGKGWAGIGYHFYIRKDGTVDEGRPLWAAGGHTLNYNNVSVGICVEGNYDVETVMPMAQLQVLRELLAYLKGLYPNAAIKCHRDLNATACPGRWFPLGEVLKYNEPAAPAEREEEDMIVYKDIQDVPEYWRGEVQQLLDMGVIDGGTDRGKCATDVNLTATEAKLCAIFTRAMNKMKEGA